MAIFKTINYKETVLKQSVNKITGTMDKNFIEVERSLGLKDFMKEELGTMRFWLMLKLRDERRFSSRWERYLENLNKRLEELFEGPDVKQAIKNTIAKLERSTWNTMPSSFLSQMGVPRVVRR